MGFPNDIQHTLATEGVIARRDHPKLGGAIDWLLRNGGLRPVDSIDIRIRALMRWNPDAILVGEAAAWVSFWPEIRISGIACSLKHQHRPQCGYEFTRRQIPPELVVHRFGVRYIAGADGIGSLRERRWRWNRSGAADSSDFSRPAPPGDGTNKRPGGWITRGPMIEEHPEEVLGMVREAIEMLTAVRRP